MGTRYLRRPAGLPEPLGRYSHLGIGSGEVVAIAGQVSVDEGGELAGPGVPEQTRQVFVNLGHALSAAELGFADILKMNTYLVGEDAIEQFMRARTEVFEKVYPAGEYPPNTLVVVSRLVEPQFLVEIEALAMRATGE